ncbi:MAG: hypothetical protein PVF73_11170 [Bacteroidales bacterium]|jgi:hypothetical protein
MRVFLIIVLVGISHTVCSQEEPGPKKHQVGANAGFTTGLGISYRYWPDKPGIQFTVIPAKYEDNTFISLGLTGLYTLAEKKYFKPFLFLGNHYVITSEDQEYNIGFGPGFSVGSDVRFNFMLGYGFYDVLYTFNMFPTMEAGVYYKF